MRKKFLVLLAFYASSVFCVAEDFPRESYLHYVRYLLFQKANRPDQALTELILAYQSNPKEIGLLDSIVSMSLEMGLVEIAKVYSRRAMEVAPNDPHSLVLAARVAQAQGDTEKALEFLLRAHKINPQHSQTLLELAALYAERGNRRESGRFMDMYLKVSPGSLELLKLKASFELQDKNPKALQSYKEAFTSDPRDPEILDGLSAAYQMFSSTSALIEFLRQETGRDPDNTMVAARLCRLQTETADRRVCFEQLLSVKPQLFSAVMGLLETYEQEERWEEALDVLREHRATLDRDASYYLKESFYLLRLGNDEDALQALERGAKEHPDNDSIAYFLALGYQDVGQWEKAKQQLAAIYHRYPQWKEPAYNYALACGETGDTQTMEKVLVALHKQYQDDAVIANALGFTWLEQGKNLEEAKALIEWALRQEPENLAYLDSLAWAYFKMGDAHKAYTILEPAVRHSNDPEMMLHLAEILRALSRPQEAWEAVLAARFELAAKPVPGKRLLGQLAVVEKKMDRKSRPSVTSVLDRRLHLLEKAPLAFRCDLNLPGTKKFRSKLMLRQAFDSHGHLEMLVWLPGSLQPASSSELVSQFPEAGPFVEDFKRLADDFFLVRSWRSKEKGKGGLWKIREDFYAEGKFGSVAMVLSDFYSAEKQMVAPRTLKFNGSRIAGVCQALED